MKISNRQIGWSQEAILLHGISKQLSFLYSLTSSFPRGVLPLEVNATNKTVWNNGPGDIDTNTSLGLNAFASNQVGYENTVYGYSALNSNKTGYQNTSIGAFSLSLNNEGGIQNTAIGEASSYMSTGSYNTTVTPFLGALYLFTGVGNTSVGLEVLGNVTSGNYNTGIGVNAMDSNPFSAGPDTEVTGSYNIATGFQSNITLTSGNNNISFFIGLGSDTDTGSRNIAFSFRQPGITSANNNVFIGGFNGGTPNLDGQVIIATGAGSARRYWYDTNGALTITVAPTNGSGVTTEKVILIDVVSDANGMASIKTIDYIDTNATTVNLTLANLNATYPGASIGFRVQCMSIAGAPKIYTKVSTTNWCSEAVLSVA